MLYTVNNIYARINKKKQEIVFCLKPRGVVVNYGVYKTELKNNFFVQACARKIYLIGLSKIQNLKTCPRVFWLFYGRLIDTLPAVLKF